jgi:hypothetical protein
MMSPLSLDQLTRDTWGSYDPLVIAQLAPLAGLTCYQPKFYKSPDSVDELMTPGQYVQHGLKITPGSLIFGTYLPCNPATLLPGNFNVQITDTSLDLEWFDESVPSLFLANYKPVNLDAYSELAGSFPSLLNCCWPVVGNGLIMVEFWNGPTTQRVELVFGVLEVVG